MLVPRLIEGGVSRAASRGNPILQCRRSSLQRGRQHLLASRGIAVLTTIGIAAWYTIVPRPRRREIGYELILIVGLTAGYTYCFSLTARCVPPHARRFGVSVRLHVWLPQVIPFGLGCIMPFLVSFAVYDKYSSAQPPRKNWPYSTSRTPW